MMFHDFPLPCGLSQNVDLDPIQPLGSSPGWKNMRETSSHL
jgi:hypothetical protein